MNNIEENEEDAGRQDATRQDGTSEFQVEKQVEDRQSKHQPPTDQAKDADQGASNGKIDDDDGSYMNGDVSLISWSYVAC